MQMQKLDHIRGYANTEQLIEAYNALIDAHNALVEVVETHGQQIDALARPSLHISPTDARRTFVRRQDANPL